MHSTRLLQKQLQQLSRNPAVGFSVRLADESDIFEWDVTVSGPPDTPYSGGLFKATMRFPDHYPFEPPTVTFTSKMWHPNVFPTGDVCMSILQAPTAFDPPDPEFSCERWSPHHTVESVLLCIISILSSPDCDQPANSLAAEQWRHDREEFINEVTQCVRMSQEQSS